MRRLAIGLAFLGAALLRPLPAPAERVPSREVDLRIRGVEAGLEERVGGVVAEEREGEGEGEGEGDGARGGGAVRIVVRGRGPIVLRAAAGGHRIRLTRRGEPVSLPLAIARRELPLVLEVRGVEESRAPRDVLLVASRADDPSVTDSVVLTVVRLPRVPSLPAALLVPLGPPTPPLPPTVELPIATLPPLPPRVGPPAVTTPPPGGWGPKGPPPQGHSPIPYPTEITRVSGRTVSGAGA